MSSDIPYMGSKISLISKAEIRYEGILYSIDAEESTVALAQVRSFGTEDRQAENPVHAREEVFDYIIFRGGDIKDLHVCDTSKVNQMPADPAIVESSMSSNNLAPSNHQQQQQQLGNNPPTPGQQQQQQQQGNSNNYMYMSPNSYPPTQQQQQHQMQQQQQQPPTHPYPMYNAFGNNYLKFGGNQSTHSGSRSPSPGSTPQNHCAQHPSTPGLNHLSYPQPTAPEGRGGGGTMRGVYTRGGGGAGAGGRFQGNYSQAVTAPSNHHREEFSRTEVLPHHQTSNNMQQQQQQQYYSKESDQRMPRFPPGEGGGYGGMRPHAMPFNNNYNEFRYSRGRPPNRGYYSGMQRGVRGGSGGIGRGGSSRGYMGGRGSFPRGMGRPGSLNFDSEFDFEGSNAKFDKYQIEKELKEKLNIGGSGGVGTSGGGGGGSEEGLAREMLNGDDEASLSNVDPSVVASSTDNHCYDKTKSFFDSISCEALDQNRSHRRPNWKEERKLNFETFGLRGSSNHRYRGRSRGGYYNRNGYGGHAGGAYFNREQASSSAAPFQRSWGNQPRGGGGRGKYNWYNSSANKHDNNFALSSNNSNTDNVTSKSNSNNNSESNKK